MNEKEILISHALDKKRQSADSSMITHTNFLSLDEISIVKTTDREYNEYVNTYYYGGYDDSERQIALFVPKFFEFDSLSEFLQDNEEDNPLCIVRLKKDKFTILSHRDYLGAIMGLGLKREMVGDIKVTESGADVFCLKTSAEYICENLKKSGRGSVTGEILSADAFSSTEDKYEMCFTTVSSLRLDGVVAAFFNLSRSSAAETVNKGLVYVNSSQCLKGDFTLKEGDKLVLRGKGKTVLSEIKGTSKKGKLKIEYKRYI
ncbi:MAG: RNA-binding protein [Clostridia bacterium]|nr:RNA-binding protein [Clostridia bacterium]